MTLAFEWGPSVPLPYAGRPEDIANAAVFLASPASAFVTGECVSATWNQANVLTQVFEAAGLID